MNGTDRKKYLLILMAAATLVAAIVLFWWKGSFLPSSIPWTKSRFDWESEEVILANRQVKIMSEGRMIYCSDWNWNIQAVGYADLDQDGVEELIFLTWKRGNYGDHRPFWVEKNDWNLKQHIFIFHRDEERKEKLRPMWMSSEVGKTIADLTTGASGTVILTEDDGDLSVWKWEGFGLKMVTEQTGKVDFLAAGDQLLHLPLLQPGLRTGNYDYLYERIAETVHSYDLASLNQETPLVADPAFISDYPRFGSPIETAEAVKNAGFDIVSAATNHALDQKRYGIDTTLGAYEAQGILCCGIHRENGSEARDAVILTEVNGIRIAFLSFAEGINALTDTKRKELPVDLFSDQTRLTEALQYARANADAVIVFAHWGEEYEKTAGKEQRALAAKLCAAGVDVVIGTHPHVVQEYEWLTGANGRKTLVCYSLGNLISAQKDADCLRGALASFRMIKMPWSGVEITEEKLLPVQTVLTDRPYVELTKE